ncbi:MAG: hemerythrin family protein [Defluviitaleaceae bacterium]|nr:hemerythrin family protein [Defluviitaleaceae bacterium]MCL2836978.1 hemerythrin family protein [Defluviitaleaceae bacterium]
MEVINPLLGFLESYTAEHFADEEALQVESGYPGLEEHRKAHKAFIGDFVDLKNTIDAEGMNPGVIKTVKSLLVDWVVNHISGEDLRFAVYFKKNYRA